MPDDLIPTIVVCVAFLATLATYVVLSLNGSPVGVMDELLLLEGGALAGIAAPRARR